VASQYGQDRFVIEWLRGMRHGYFLDTGAAEGIDASNTYVLERELGWRGLCVEPNERAFRQLVQNRRVTCENVCLYSRVADLPFLEAGHLGGLVDEFATGQLDFVVATKRLALRADGLPAFVTKRTETLRSLLDRVGAPRVIDYWSLDTEGSELALLESFPFDRYQFNVLTVEHNGLPVREPIRALLEARGFERVTSLVIDDCYVRTAAFPHRHSRSAAWR
jgi:hypothetical protein